MSGLANSLRRIDLGSSLRRARVHRRSGRIIRRQGHIVHGVRVLVAVLLVVSVLLLRVRPSTGVIGIVASSTNEALEARSNVS